MQTHYQGHVLFSAKAKQKNLAHNHIDNDMKTEWSFLYSHFRPALSHILQAKILEREKSFKCYVNITTGKGKDTSSHILDLESATIWSP